MGARDEAALVASLMSLKRSQDEVTAPPESSLDEMLGTRDEAALAEVAKDPVTGNEAVPAEPSAAPGEPTEGWILAVDYQSVDEPGEPTDF